MREGTLDSDYPDLYSCTRITWSNTPAWSCKQKRTRLSVHPSSQKLKKIITSFRKKPTTSNFVYIWNKILRRSMQNFVYIRAQDQALEAPHIYPLLGILRVLAKMNRDEAGLFELPTNSSFQRYLAHICRTLLHKAVTQNALVQTLREALMRK